ncbi:4'-phosphopantetheinyl transferase superfamily protein [Microbacterium lacticum]|uniref:4'-phosphopantetheinyl transferase family protein n=1 Tax=Microbacterium lacticum TaxID=33885 RepID=UPI002430155B|nr:4'-phosphopantetheinyl transferase superfamily protein [Microbacterium lacticum]
MDDDLVALRRLGDSLPLPPGIPVIGAIARADVALATLRHHPHLLSTAEADRVKGLSNAAQQAAFIAVRAIARVAVSSLTRTPPDEVRIEQRCSVCGAPGHGRPRIRSRTGDYDAVFVSWSHAGAWVMVAAASVPIGVDIETVEAHVPRTPAIFCASELSALDRCNDPSETALRWWTRKEAIVKLGRTDLDGIGTADVRASAPTAGPLEGVRMCTSVTRDYVASVACIARIDSSRS